MAVKGRLMIIFDSLLCLNRGRFRVCHNHKESYMSVPAQIETPKAILLEMEIIFTVIATGA